MIYRREELSGEINKSSVTSDDLHKYNFVVFAKGNEASPIIQLRCICKRK